MRFVMEMWHGSESDDPVELVRLAVASIRENPDLVWRIEDDEGDLVCDDVPNPVEGDW